MISGWDDLPTDAAEEVRLEIVIKRTGATSSSGQYLALGNKDMFQASADAKVSIPFVGDGLTV
jgi:hypothetical protein